MLNLSIKVGEIFVKSMVSLYLMWDHVGGKQLQLYILCGGNIHTEM